LVGTKIIWEFSAALIAKQADFLRFFLRKLAVVISLPDGVYYSIAKLMRQAKRSLRPLLSPQRFLDHIFIAE